MGRRFQELAFTPLVQEEQKRHGSREQYQRVYDGAKAGDALGPEEQEFVAGRDSFYMASVSETGWPYIQHRGGPAGFLRVLGPKLLGFADLRGNKQYISLGNLEHDDRVALFLMDYPRQTRLKVLGRVEIHEGDARAAELLPQLATGEKSAVAERAMLIHVEAFDWNCPQHITPRYTLEELEESLAPVRRRVETLEAENAELRRRISDAEKRPR
ncbi:MAG TPA: pyridoxamine 5'-phosphate oxidase family protein [Acidobacteriaceae bacterium]|nr:pyridoxamine 5'-phosphate oxidase family protein [Acidobacteriaceae bacterium]